ncbi:hypothetical protein [Conexibacter sp. SYSU D00693]|uniref:hypothetical protein n=1 Tax=Conexibacter sp. SYSU D00693 TaxID=2812560 RepID=UPI00196B4409|nr:hypothetical protein [Conexibacter sp. SYSU D00693]
MRATILRAVRVVAQTEHPEARELVASAHCIQRFRQRMPIREPGADQVVEGLRRALEDADVSAWPPAWAVSDRPAELWAVSGALAFPLARTPDPGRWLAVTCLRRGDRR